MKIEVAERGSYTFYDELLYICSFYREIRKKPQRKVHRLTRFLSLYIFGVLIITFIEIYLYIKNRDAHSLFMGGIFSSFLILSVVFLVVFIVRIKKMMAETGVRVVVIDEKGVKFTDRDKELKLSWENIACITVNKYSICFIPKSNHNIIISLDRKYQNDVEEVLKKYGYADLFYDNSRLYNLNSKSN